MEFQIVANGYSPEQVNQVISTFSEKYKALYNQCIEQKKQYDEETKCLKRRIFELGNTAPGQPCADIAAQQLAAKARADANRIIREVEREIDDLLTRRKRVLIETRRIFQEELDALPVK